MRKFSLKKALAGAAIIFVATTFPLSLARADDPSPTPALYSNSTPAPTTSGDHSGEERHRVDVEHGFEANQITIVLAAIIVAGGLAIGIGRRRRQ